MSETKTLSELAHNEFEHRLGSEFLREAEKHTSKLPTMERVTRHDTKGAWSSLCFTFPGVRVHLFSHMVYPLWWKEGTVKRHPSSPTTLPPPRTPRCGRIRTMGRPRKSLFLKGLRHLTRSLTRPIFNHITGRLSCA